MFQNEEINITVDVAELKAYLLKKLNFKQFIIKLPSELLACSSKL